MTEIDMPEGVTVEVSVYLTSDATGMTAIIRIGEFKRLPSFQDVINPTALAKNLPIAPDWRLMTRDEIKAHTATHEDAS
jgi:hypothetical protein